MTALAVESAADVGRWHGVNERIFVSELPNAITFPSRGARLARMVSSGSDP